MKLTKLSATSVKRWLNCPRMWVAHYQAADDDRPAEMSGSAASLGSALHEAFEHWVADGYYLEPLTATDRELRMRELFHEAYWKRFASGERYDEGNELALQWMERQNWVGRTVISTEEQLVFDLPTSAGPVRFTFIIDRLDELDNGDIEIIDYKSGVRNMTPDSLHENTQALIYALAVQRMYPNRNIIVTMDMTRYGTVGARFSKTRNRQTWEWLKEIAEDIIATPIDEAPETLSSECRWCVRKHECSVLQSHAAVTGVMSLDDPDAAADRRLDVQHAIAALTSVQTELDEFLMDWSEENNLDQWATEGGTQVAIHSKASRSANTTAMSDTLAKFDVDAGEFVTLYGGMGVTAIDKAIKDTHRWSDEFRVALGNCIDKSYGKSKVVVK